MSDHKGVMVIGEILECKLAPISAELLGCGRALADELKEDLSCLLIGDDLSQIAREAAFQGADKVYISSDLSLRDYQPEAYVPIVVQVIKSNLPRIVLLGQTAFGRDLAPRLSIKLGTGLSMDCLELKIDTTNKSLLSTRPVYGGNALAVFSSDLMPQIATIRVKAMSPLERDSNHKVEIVNIPGKADPSLIKAKLQDKVKEELAGIRLEDASVIVCGGRGLGGPDGFKQLEELAKVLNGAVGASRPPCDSGWVPSTLQIGLTGKIVSPELYIAVGLSGSSQHMAGCSGSKGIVAINKDPEANIFREARFGAVGDWKQILPAFTGKLKELLGT